MDNVNSETGIAYGVFYTGNCQCLCDDIFSRGDDLSYEAWKEEVASRLRNAIGGVIDDYSHQASEIAKGHRFDSLIEALGDSYECDEPCHSYEYDTEHGKVKLYQTWLGGAPLVYVIESPYVLTNAAGCSPCVPNAGNLDSEPNGSVTCYCLEPGKMALFNQGGLWTNKFEIETRPILEESTTE
jgi:hypothetical protein